MGEALALIVQVYCPCLIGGNFIISLVGFRSYGKNAQGKKGETVELKDFSE